VVRSPFLLASGACQRFSASKVYRIGFYSAEPDEPPHVHVNKAGHEAKFWIAPTQLSWNKGFKEFELLEIIRILETNEVDLLNAWNEAE
jgi:hypothetical protein